MPRTPSPRRTRRRTQVGTRGQRRRRRRTVVRSPRNQVFTLSPEYLGDTPEYPGVSPGYDYGGVTPYDASPHGAKKKRKKSKKKGKKKGKSKGKKKTQRRIRGRKVRLHGGKEMIITNIIHTYTQGVFEGIATITTDDDDNHMIKITSNGGDVIIEDTLLSDISLWQQDETDRAIKLWLWTDDTVEFICQTHEDEGELKQLLGDAGVMKHEEEEAEEGEPPEDEAEEDVPPDAMT